MARAGQVRTMRLQGPLNWIIRGMLRTPVVSNGLGRYLLTVHAVGRKSGKHYTVPVAYLPHEGDLLIGTPFRWARNLRTGEPVAVRLRGKRRWADVHVATDEEAVVRDYAVIARANHNFASFNKIALDAAGNPDPADLHRAWREGARVIRLTPR
jgi:deazaflavin-dependent oxidoreductase (nitroreductase family)